MGTYTTNYNLFMPTVGETGWGELVNGNFSTIDTTMKGLDTRIGTVEPLSVIHVDENQNVTFPAKITATEVVGSVGNFESTFSPKLYFTGDISTNSDGYDIGCSIPAVRINISSANFVSNGVEYGQISFPKYTSLIDITKANYTSDIDFSFQLYKSFTHTDPTSAELYRDGVKVGNFTINNPSQYSNTITVTVPMYDKSVWYIKYVGGYTHNNYSYAVITSEVKLYTT